LLLLVLAQSWQHLYKTDCDKTTINPGSLAHDKTTSAPNCCCDRKSSAFTPPLLERHLALINHDIRCIQ